MRRLTLACIAVAVLLTPVVASAQINSHTQGFQLSGQLSGASFKPEDTDQESGGGMGIGIGYGVSRLVTIFVDADFASINAADDGEDYTLGHGDAGVRFNFGTADKKWIPYALIAASARVAQWQDVLIDGRRYDVDVTGPAFTLGGGALYFFSPALALNAGFRFTTGKMDEVTVDGEKMALNEFEFDATSMRLNVGMSWVPSGKKVAALVR